MIVRYPAPSLQLEAPMLVSGVTRASKSAAYAVVTSEYLEQHADWVAPFELVEDVDLNK